MLIKKLPYLFSEQERSCCLTAARPTSLRRAIDAKSPAVSLTPSSAWLPYGFLCAMDGQ
jgi:hypothetical protein